MMKKLISMALLTIFTTMAHAQEQNEPQKRQRQEFTAEQIAELKTKKMALALDLSDKQQRQIYEINKRNAIERKEKIESLKALRTEKKQLSSDQLFELKKSRLDKQLAQQAEMKKILNDRQFETWRKTRNVRAHKAKRKMAKRKQMKRRMRHRKAHDGK